MSPPTPIYGHSRGYRALALLAMVGIVVSLVDVATGAGVRVVGITGLTGFSVLFFYAWRKSSRRVVVLRIQEEGFSIDDPAQPFGVIPFHEIEEIRIYALLEYPMVAFRLHNPDHLRRRGPVLLRMISKPMWHLSHYQIVVQLDAWNDQVASIKSVATRTGIPVRSELV